MFPVRSWYMSIHLLIKTLYDLVFFAKDKTLSFCLENSTVSIYWQAYNISIGTFTAQLETKMCWSSSFFFDTRRSLCELCARCSQPLRTNNTYITLYKSVNIQLLDVISSTKCTLLQLLTCICFDKCVHYVYHLHMCVYVFQHNLNNSLNPNM